LQSLKNVSLTSSLDNNYEIGPEGGNKGEALKRLAKIIGVNKEEIMACGDSPNDIELLQEAGLPIAVENAKESVKAVAKLIVPSNIDNGVALAIKKYAL
ncbi:MAG: HAD family hydrolase, partial [Anaerovoracaceae bacterium]